MWAVLPIFSPRAKQPRMLLNPRLEHRAEWFAWQLRCRSVCGMWPPSGPLRVNNGDAMMPALIAGTGVGILPDFFLREALEAGSVERLLPDWSIPLGAVYWVTPLEGPLPKRVEALRTFLIEKLAQLSLGCAS